MRPSNADFAVTSAATGQPTSKAMPARTRTTRASAESPSRVDERQGRQNIHVALCEGRVSAPTTNERWQENPFTNLHVSEDQLIKSSVFAAAFLLLAAGAASAAEPRDNLATGRDLLAACTSAKALDYGMCVGYINGVVDGFLVTDRTSICMPAGITRGQLRDVVLAGIARSPRESEQEPYVAALLAVSRAFPCQKRGVQRAK